MTRLSPQILACIACALIAACGPDEPEDTPPNFVLIIADDMNWNDAGAYGHPTIQTPNIDALAASGLLFNNAVLTASSCSPSRSSIITGRYPHNTGAEQLHWPLPANQVTFVEQLREAGYWAAAAGKWHLGDAVRDRFDVIYQGNVADNWIRSLEERPDDKPFFLWLAAFDPHRAYEEGIIDTPHRPDDVRVPPYLPDTIEVRKDLALYYDEIARLDMHVGRVVEELRSQDVIDNTLVLFMSDNGRPFPRDKTTLYDGGIKTPLIASWPDVIAPGSTTDSLVSAVDLAPTFLELAEAPVFRRPQGKSFAEVLKDPSAVTRQYAFSERHWHDYEDLVRSVRTTRYKYIRNYYPDLPNTPPADAGRSPTFQKMLQMRDQGELTAEQMAPFVTPRPIEELYDLKYDPDELHNLAFDIDSREILDEMRTALEVWREETEDFIPSVRTPDEFDRETGQPTDALKRPRPSKMDMYGASGKY